jgi:predicted nucleic acid-binding protein
VPDVFVDSTIAVDVLRGVDEARRAIVSARAHGTVYIHSVVVAELVVGAASRRDLKVVDAFCAAFTEVVPDHADVVVSLKLLRRHFPADGTGWNDCLIAATALRTNASVMTLNEKHFRRIRGLRVHRPY